MGWKEEFHRLMFDEQNLEKALVLYFANKPETVFRYRKGTALDIETLRNNKIWASKLSEVNDLFEGTLEFDVESFGLHFDFLKEELLKRMIKIDDEIRRQFFLTCFCEDLESIPMWSYYADYHRGFSVEYAIDDFEQPVFPVIYQDKKPVNNIEILTESYKQKDLMIKDTQWKMENEWRILVPHGVDSASGIEIIQPKPKAIYLGVDSDENPNKRMSEDIKEYCIVNEVPLYKMKVNRIKRKIYPERIG